MIHFNFGLHDAKLPPEGVRHAPPEVYEKNLRELVKQMKATDAKLIFATTTPVPNGGNLRPTRRFGSVDQYNVLALKVMKEMDVAIDDLNADVMTIAHVFKQAGYSTAHFGKWHLGKFGDSPAPSAYGFDRAAVYSSTATTPEKACSFSTWPAIPPNSPSYPRNIPMWLTASARPRSPGSNLCRPPNSAPPSPTVPTA